MLSLFQRMYLAIAQLGGVRKDFPDGGPEADEVPGRDPFGGGHERAVEDIYSAQVAVTILIRVILFI